MFQPQLFDDVLLVEHIHADGTSSPMVVEQQPEDPAELDPERSWATGRIYVCPVCDDRVRVAPRSTEGLREGA
jgi:hypothetical protein